MKLSKLLTLVHNEFTAPILSNVAISDGYDGICRVAYMLVNFNIITLSERDRVLMYIVTHSPTTDFFAYGWKPYKKRPRKRWLKRHIRLLKRKGS